MSDQLSFNAKYSLKVTPRPKSSNPWKPSSSPNSAWNILKNLKRRSVVAEDTVKTAAPIPPPPASKKLRISPHIQDCHPMLHPDSAKQKQCSVCMGNFANLESLKTHCIRTHFNLCDEFSEPEFRECYFCCLRFKYGDTEAEFNSKEQNPEELSFIQHVQTHKGAAPFECVVCHQTFTQKRVLSSHFRQIHKNHRPVFHAAIIGDKLKSVGFRISEIEESSEENEDDDKNLDTEEKESESDEKEISREENEQDTMDTGSDSGSVNSKEE
jgi:hypothetical protein